MRDRLCFLVGIFGGAILIISIVLTIYFLIKEKDEEEENFEKYEGYVFSLNWPPSLCNLMDSKTECFNKIKNLNIENFFTINGLIPIFLNGKEIKKCNLEKEVSPLLEDQKTLDKMKIYWPGFKNSDEQLWKEKYNNYGSCFIKRIGKDVNKDFIDYFQQTLNIYNSFDFRNIFEKIYPDTEKGIYNISKNKIKNEIKSVYKENSSSFSLICDEKTKLLKEIRITLDLNFSFIIPKISDENCPEIFKVNFVNETKIPVYKKYDFNVFSLIWNPTTCKERGKYCYDLVRKKELNILMIHGLWPSYKTGIFPQWCNLGQDIDIKDDGNKLFEKLRNYWIGTYTTDESFWIIEYNKHGYCFNQKMNLSTDDYIPFFKTVIELYERNELKNIINEFYPDIIAGERKLNRTFLNKKLDEKFGKNTYTLYCLNIKNIYYLSEIRLKLDLNLKIINEGITINNCPEFFYLEFLDEEGPGKQDYGIANNYNDYMFVIMWQTTTCKIKGYQCYDIIRPLPKNVWNIHGLWPNYKNGTIPDWCNGKNDIKIYIHNDTLHEFMKNYWASTYHSNQYFWGHEFNKHGYCYNQRNHFDLNNYEIYFSKAIEIFKKYDFSNLFLDIYDQNIISGDSDINRSDIENYFQKKGFDKGTYLLVCTNITSNTGIIQPFIKEIRIRFELDFKPYKNVTDKSEFDCPSIFKAEFL